MMRFKNVYMIKDVFIYKKRVYLDIVHKPYNKILLVHYIKVGSKIIYLRKKSIK